MWSNGWIWIFYHYIKGARQTDQYGFCPSFLSTDPWAIYLPSEADPWVKFPLVYRSVHLFVPTASLPSSLYKLYRNIKLWSPLPSPYSHTQAATYMEGWCSDIMWTQAGTQIKIVALHSLIRSWMKLWMCEKKKSQSWLICRSRDRSRVAALQLFVWVCVSPPSGLPLCSVPLLRTNPG